MSLSTPRPGVFLDTVKYVLVLASPVEIVLLAISTDNNYHNIKLIPTAYKLPSDNITMLRIIGSQTGRIFMAGNDGNLYELDYSNNESSWATMLGTNIVHYHTFLIKLFISITTLVVVIFFALTSVCSCRCCIIFQMSKNKPFCLELAFSPFITATVKNIYRW